MQRTYDLEAADSHERSFPQSFEAILPSLGSAELAVDSASIIRRGAPRCELPILALLILEVWNVNLPPAMQSNLILGFEKPESDWAACASSRTRSPRSAQSGEFTQIARRPTIPENKKRARYRNCQHYCAWGANCVRNLSIIHFRLALLTRAIVCIRMQDKQAVLSHTKFSGGVR